MRASPICALLLCLIPTWSFADTETENQPVCDLQKRWYFDVKPGYYYLTDGAMRDFYGNGGFTIRGEAGYKFWGPLIVWVDGGYFKEDGHALGGSESTDLMLASITLGLKAIWYPHPRIALYAGAGPRLFLMKISNDSPFVRAEDKEFGIGGAFTGGFWFFPIPSYPNIFLDLFADYSWKNMEVEEDEVSSTDSDVNISGLTGGLGLGIRF